MIRNFRTLIINRLVRLRNDHRGVAAVEFALILPLMVLVYLGCFEISQSVIAHRKVSNIANTIGDLVAQEEVFTNADMAAIFNAGKAILTPLPSTKNRVSLLDMTITYIQINAAGEAALVWTQAPGGGDHATTGTLPSIPAYLLVANSSLVYAEVTYTYKSPSYFVVSSSQSMKSHYFFRPRQVEIIKRIES